MDKLKELLEDKNNQIIAVAVLVVIILGVALLFIINMKKNSSNSASSAPMMDGSGMPGAMGPDGMPGAMGPDGMPGAMGPNGMPGAMGPNGMGSMDGSMPSAMGPEGSMNPDGSMTATPEASSATSDATQTASTLTGKPMEPGRIDPFAPIGVAKASKTKTFGDALKNRMALEGVDFRLPSTLEAVSFTEYVPGVTRVGYLKTPQDLKREAEKKKAQEAAEKAKVQKKVDALINSVVYQKPSNVRLSSVMKSSKGKTAAFEVVYGSRTDYKNVKEGEEFTYGYYGTKELKAKVKSIGENKVVLKAKDADVEWTFNLSAGNSYNQGMNGMGAMGGMNPGMQGGMGTMGGMNMPGAMGGMNGMNGMNMPGGMGGMNPGMQGGMMGGMYDK